MKILVITNVPSPYRVDFFNELGKHCELTVLFERKSASDRASEWHETNFENFNGVFLSGRNIGTDSAFCPSVLKWLKPQKFDILIVGGYSTPTAILAQLYMRIKKIAYILNADGGFVYNDKWYKKIIKRFLISSATYWLSSSDKTTEYLCYYGADKNRCYKYPFTSLKTQDIVKTSLSQKQKEEKRAKLGIPDLFTFIAVGQFIPRKGFDILLKSWKNMQNASLLIIGGGELQYDTSDLNNIAIMPFMKKDLLFEYYQVADAFVLPTREDIWGLVINEAMACGLPVVSTNRCLAAIELVEDGMNGYIVEAGDEKALFHAMYTLKENQFQIKEMSDNCINKISDFTIEKMAIRHIEIFKRIQNNDN